MSVLDMVGDNNNFCIYNLWSKEKKQTEKMIGATTAIKRKSPPEPLRWLHERGLLIGRTLDYGCGRDVWYGMDGYDPYWKPITIVGKYDTITCLYVLNVVNEDDEPGIMNNIKSHLAGKAYIAVRRDIPVQGKEGRGVRQRYCNLNLPIIDLSRYRAIYELA